MRLQIRIQKYIALFLFITINVLFYFKYFYRLSLVYALIAVGGYLCLNYIVFYLYKYSKLTFSVRFWTGVLILLTIGSGVVLHLMPKESLNVDRWEMIQIFWDAFLDGIYPYGVHSETGNYPGPMPIYFLLAYPFYKLDEIGWMTVTGIWIMFFYFKNSLDRNRLSLLMILLLSSLACYWEIFARSTIFINALLFAIYYFELLKERKKIGISFYGLAVLGGILFSTRTVFVLPLIIWGVFVCIQKHVEIMQLIKWGITFMLTFALTFLPLYYMDPETFIRLNPFVTQGDVLLPFYYVIGFMWMAFVFSFFCKKTSDLIFYSGLSLFLTISGHIVYALFDGGIKAYLTAGADISYYLFCVPFLLKTIVEKDNQVMS